MRGGKRVPVVVVDLREIDRDLRIVEDQAGVTIGSHALVGPVVTAEHHDLAVDDDRLVVARRLKPEDLFWKAKRDKDVQALLFHHVAADDADIELFIDLVLERPDQQPEFGEVVAGAAEVDVLVLEPDALGRRIDQLRRVLRVIVRCVCRKLDSDRKSVV